MDERNLGGTGDPHTFGGREPYEDEQDDPAIDTRDGSEWEGFEYELQG
jgi:hypothetical protein